MSSHEMNHNVAVFLELQKSGLWGTKCAVTFDEEIDWEQVLEMAKKQTVAGVLIDGCMLNGIRYNRGERREGVLKEERGERLPSEMRLKEERGERREERDYQCVDEIKESSGALRLCVPNQVPKEVWFRLVKEVARIEDANKKMNAFLPKVCKKMKGSVLLKGQGVGMCYPNPLHRTSGDIDLFFYHEEDYERGKAFAMKAADYVGGEESKRKHFDFNVDGIIVELHGEIRLQISRRTRKEFPKVVEYYFSNRGERREGVLKEERGERREERDYQCVDEKKKDAVASRLCVLRKMPLAPANFDAVFIFVHLLQHYFNSGIGLRQVCDWMRFMYFRREEIDQELLLKDIDQLGIKKAWQYFGNMAVELLGCPAEVMPLYDARYSKEGRIVLEHIFYSGNFGHQDYFHKTRPKGYLTGKIHSFIGQLYMRLQKLRLFPSETLYGIPETFAGSIRMVMGKNKTKD